MKRRLSLLLLLALSQPAPAATDDQAPGLPAEVVMVSARPLTPAIAAVGTLEANEQIQLRPEQAGRILRIGFIEGQRVSAGDVLFELDASTYAAQLKQAEAQLEFARQAYHRAQSLLLRKVGSETERDNALAQLRVDEAQVELARTQLDKMTIRAPFDGQTGLRQVSPGDYVSVGQDLVELVDASTMKVDFRIPEIYLPALRPGQPVGVRVDAFPGGVFDGEVYAMAPGADATSHSLQLRARIANQDGRLRPGLFAQIELKAAQELQALFVPEQAIIARDGGFSLMRVNAEKRVELVEVELGQRRPGEVQVLTGIEAGDLIVTAGQIKLQPGMPVTPVRTDEDAARPEQVQAP